MTFIENLLCTNKVKVKLTAAVAAVNLILPLVYHAIYKRTLVDM